MQELSRLQLLARGTESQASLGYQRESFGIPARIGKMSQEDECPGKSLLSVAAKFSTPAAILPLRPTSTSKGVPWDVLRCPPALQQASTKQSNCATATNPTTLARACSKQLAT